MDNKCPQCHDGGRLCGLGQTNELFNITIREDFRKRTYIPCFATNHVVDKFCLFLDEDSAQFTLLTSHGYTFQVVINTDSEGRSYFHPCLWRELATRYSLKAGTDLLVDITQPDLIIRLSIPSEIPRWTNNLRLVKYVVKEMVVTPASKFHWKDLKHIIKFVGRLDSLTKRFHAGGQVGICVPVVHTLDRMNCIIHKNMKLPPSVVPELMPTHGPITLAIGHNKKFMARYIISPRTGTIHITKWEAVMAMRPHMKMGANVMLMLYEGTEGLFLFIDDML